MYAIRPKSSPAGAETYSQKHQEENQESTFTSIYKILDLQNPQKPKKEAVSIRRVSWPEGAERLRQKLTLGNLSVMTKEVVGMVGLK